MKVLISQHAAVEGPGYLAPFLARHGIGFDIVQTGAGEPLPPTLNNYSGLVLMGGPMSVNDELPWIPQTLGLIREAVAADRPVLGHCLGGQLISKALGGTVKPHPVSEIGWFPVSAAGGASARTWLSECPPEFEVFHWHGEAFSIPGGADHILQSRDCFHQAFALGKTLALQCHIEMTADMVRQWSVEFPLSPCATVQDPHELCADLDRRVRALNTIADKIYTRWIEGL